MRQKLEHFDRDKLRRTIIKGLPCNFVPHRTGGSEFARNGQVNIRKEVWKMMTKLDELKMSCVAKYNNERESSDPEVRSGEELFNLLVSKSKQDNSNKFLANLSFEISKDLCRTDLGNSAYERDMGDNNPLYNVLMAYGLFDKEVGYCQGMNIVASWILKYT